MASTTGSGGQVLPLSNTINRIKSVKILDPGFEYSSDKTLRPEASISPTITVRDSNTIIGIDVVNGGKNYQSPPILVIVDPETRNVVGSGAIEPKMLGNSINEVESTERLVRVIVNREEERLSKNLSLLATISSSAPYIGLLGTVIGIINAFQGLSTTAQLTLSSVAPGISEALVATAVGLLAAIPALIAYNQFSKKLDNLINGSLAFAEQLIIQINKK